MSELPKSDPRVYYAAERTFLAWVRSGITLIAMGFVISKFGLLMNLITSGQRHNTGSHNIAEVITTNGTNYLGVIVLLIGVFIIIIAQRNHQHFVQTLPLHDVPVLPTKWLPALLTYTMAVAGISLSLYLLFI